MHWEDFHLHEFTIQGKVYGISYEGGICFGDDPHKIMLKDLQMQVKERLFYKYNFHIPWEVEIRLEKILPMNLKRIYPVCIGGNNIAPSEDYNSPIDFIEKQPSKFIDGMDSLIEDLRTIKKEVFQLILLEIKLLKWLIGLIKINLIIKILKIN